MLYSMIYSNTSFLRYYDYVAIGANMGILNTESKEQEKESTNIGDSNVSESITMGNIQEEEKSPTIILNGPLSEVMAKALNMVLSNESYLADSILLYNIHKNEVKGISDKDLFVYTTSSDNIVDDNSVIKTLDNIQEKSKGFNNIIISIECDKVTTYTQNLHNLCLESNYKVFTNINHTARYILNTI